MVESRSVISLLISSHYVYYLKAWHRPREGALKGQHIILPDTRAEKKEDQLVGSSTVINWSGWVANWYIKVKLVSLVHGPRDQTEFLLRAESTFSRQ